MYYFRDPLRAALLLVVVVSFVCFVVLSLSLLTMPRYLLLTVCYSLI